ncbi:MAG: type IV pilin protein [Halothiobacillaceae bacterium]
MSMFQVSKVPARRGNGQPGFTLIELMIVVVVIALLAAIAYPSYQEYVRKAERADAQATLLEAAQFMERWYTTNNRYDEDLDGDDVSLPSNLQQSPSDGDAKYNITLDSVARNSYELHAAPVRDDACGTFILHSTGQKELDGNTKDVADCWR